MVYKEDVFRQPQYRTSLLFQSKYNMGLLNNRLVSFFFHYSSNVLFLLLLTNLRISIYYYQTFCKDNG